MTNVQPNYGIGTVYRTRGKNPRDCMVTDVLRTYDAFGNLVKVRYVSIHKCMGQMVTEHDVLETTIKMGVIEAMPFIGVPMVIGQNDYIETNQGEEHEHA